LGAEMSKEGIDLYIIPMRNNLLSSILNHMRTGSNIYLSSVVQQDKYLLRYKKPVYSWMGGMNFKSS
jgi:hypothetical protein